MLSTLVRIRPFLSCLLTLSICFGLTARAEETAMQWPDWRGPQQNSVSTENGLIESWNPKGGAGSNLLWKNEELGSRSSPVVFDGRLYTIVRDKPGTEVESEKVVCVDATTGKKIWEYRINIYLCEVPDTRVGWSCCACDPETGRVYVQSVCGYFCCLEGRTGELVWDRSLLEEYGLINTYGGRTNVPKVFEDLVLCSAVVVGWGDSAEYGFLAKPAHRFMAFDKATGELRWLNGTSISPYDTTYSTPTITVLGGQTAMVFGSGDGEIWAIQPRTGKHLWHYPFSRRGINASPLVVGDTVYASHSEENVVGNAMGAVVALDGTMTGDLTDKEKWIRYQLMVGKSSPVMADGKLCVVTDGAKMHLLDPATGNSLSRRPVTLGRVMRSTPLVADGKLYACSSGGRWVVAKLTADGAKILGKEFLRGEANHGSPVVSEGRIYLPTTAALYCLGNTENSPSADPLPKPPRETPAEQDQVPAQLQVVPYDVLLKPGESQQFSVRLYNSQGQLLKRASVDEVEFGLAGNGEITAAGEYKAPAEVGHETAVVKCQVGELTASARIRVVPPLPWSFDFEDAEKVPLTWIGGRVRYVIREADGNRFAAKRDVLPTPKNPRNKLGTRSQLSMGHIDLSDYTIQADFAAGEKNGRMPDYGVTNSRYSMTMRSTVGELRLYSWSPHDYRTSASVKFEPSPNTWYTMKLRVEAAGEDALVRGKLWPRDESEPDEWTIEMVDSLPHRHGSPGLFGKSEVGEFYVDNIKVYENQ